MNWFVFEFLLVQKDGLFLVYSLLCGSPSFRHGDLDCQSRDRLTRGGPVSASTRGLSECRGVSFQVVSETHQSAGAVAGRGTPRARHRARVAGGLHRRVSSGAVVRLER